jgi:hypothetical protein
MQIEIRLTSQEELSLEFKAFEYQGAIIALDLFVRSDKPYSDEHYNRVMNTFLDKYSVLQNYLLELMTSRGHKFPLHNFEFTITDNLLTIHNC